MASLVLELQKEALDQNFPVSHLLRKALTLSIKLDNSQIQHWIERELSGYGKDDEIPKYRNVNCSLYGHNPYHGWQPIDFNDERISDGFSKINIKESISKIEHAFSNSSKGYSTYSPPRKIKNVISELLVHPCQIAFLVSKSEQYGVLSAVRDGILYWALELEKNKILGEGMSFTEQEKTEAKTVNYQITNNIGSMNNSQLMQDSPQAIQTLSVSENIKALESFVTELNSKIDELTLTPDLKSELTAEILTIRNQIESPKPKTIILTESIKSIRNILEGVTGSLIASGLLQRIGAFL